MNNDKTSSVNKTKAGYAEGLVSIFVNTALFVLKLWAGILTGSIALTADAWHTLSDSVSSAVVIIAVKLSAKKPDKEHPFGHGRWEQIASIFIAFFLAVIALDFFKESVIHFTHKETVHFGTIAVAITITSIIVKEILAQYAFCIARKTGNITIKADAWHHRSDALSSLVVLAGIWFAKYFWWIDSLLGFIISIMLLYAAYKIVKETIAKLLGEEADPKLIDEITRKVKNIYPDDLQLHHFHIHNYVTHKELTLHIKLEKNLTIETGHKIATNIEMLISKHFGIIATVHVEPLDFYHTTD
ncbi:MAG: cation diffusion facilitator family transporter [Dysgonamonadaceae bacterium]|jgi:cation diffusion facilitator family transporter|nr:cation diffusion facilitator family transporter [Dysgonamonadaceae bacterium]